MDDQDTGGSQEDPSSSPEPSAEDPAAEDSPSEEAANAADPGEDEPAGGDPATDDAAPQQDRHSGGGVVSSLYHHVPHLRTVEHVHGLARPDKVHDHLRMATAAQRFNSKLGLAITLGVGTMWSAYVFTVLALVSLPAVLSQVSAKTFHFFPHWLISASLIALVAWVAQTFLQLVLLPIIIVGQNIQARASDKRAEDTYKDAEAVLHECLQLQEHLKAQDEVLTNIIARLSKEMDAASG